MKSLIVLSSLLLSAQSFSKDQCYLTAKKAAFNYAYADESVTTMEEFEAQLASEDVKIEKQGSWQKEFWAFGDGSSFIHVTVHAVKSKCFVKEVSRAQDDQDAE